MKQQLKPNLSGHVRIYHLSHNNVDLAYDGHNAIDVNALNVLAAMLGDQPGAKLDNINIYNGVTLLAARPIITTTMVNPTTVQFQAQFEMTSFSGAYDKVEMTSTALGIFSSFTVALTKATSEHIAIVWQIEII